MRCTNSAMNATASFVSFLHYLVQSDNETMGSVSDSFAQHFQTPGARFQARCLYASLLRQNVLEDVRERIAAIYILRNGYTCEICSFPFLHVFLQVWSWLDSNVNASRQRSWCEPSPSLRKSEAMTLSQNAVSGGGTRVW